jgi:hypothetical protein
LGVRQPAELRLIQISSDEIGTVAADRALRELSTPLTMLNGKPLCQVVSEFSSQPWSSLPANLCTCGVGIDYIVVK